MLNDDERFALRFGPYAPPRVDIGDFLECELRGELQVRAWSQGRIPWPQAFHPARGSRMLIVCGDLARAIRCESNQAVVFWFGGNTHTVGQWRRALDVPTSTAGTKALRRAWMPHTVTPEERLLGLKRSAVSDARHVARPKQCKANLKKRHFNARIWNLDEVALLGTMPDKAVAAQIGCSLTAVVNARRERNIAAFFSKVWETRRERAKGQEFIGQEFIEIDPAKLLARRAALNLPQKVVAARVGTPAYYIKLEIGVSRRVRSTTLERLARALECHPDELRRE